MFKPEATEHLKLFLAVLMMEKLIFGALDVSLLNCSQEKFSFKVKEMLIYLSKCKVLEVLGLHG